MNPKQRACLVVGFFLLIGATLFPPWHWSERMSFGPGLSETRSGNFYGFLLKPRIDGATIQLSRLVVEWALIVFVTGGLFFLAGKASAPQSDSNLGRKTTSQETRRHLYPLSIALYILIVALGVVSYTSIRKIRRLETGIQNVKGILDSDSKVGPPPGYYEVLPPPEGAVPLRPVGVLTPLRASPQLPRFIRVENGVPCFTDEQINQMVQAEYDRVVDGMRGQAERQIETLKQIRNELDKLN